MGKIIAIVNQKGGVGKTTTAVNLTAALTDLGKRVLLCDFDPQANATSGMGVDKRKIKYSSYDVTINGVDIQSAIVGTQFGDVLPSSADLAGAGVELIGTEDREHQLKGALESVKDSYDCIFVDCPPSRGSAAGPPGPPGRRNWCGHRTWSAPHRISPIWDSGASSPSAGWPSGR